MQTKLNPYLGFHDNAREAMGFYRSVFGGDLLVSTFKEIEASQSGGCVTPVTPLFFPVASILVGMVDSQSLSGQVLTTQSPTDRLCTIGFAAAGNTPPRSVFNYT